MPRIISTRCIHRHEEELSLIALTTRIVLVIWASSGGDIGLALIFWILSARWTGSSWVAVKGESDGLWRTPGSRVEEIARRSACHIKGGFKGPLDGPYCSSLFINYENDRMNLGARDSRGMRPPVLTLSPSVRPNFCPASRTAHLPLKSVSKQTIIYLAPRFNSFSIQTVFKLFHPLL